MNLINKERQNRRKNKKNSLKKTEKKEHSPTKTVVYYSYKKEEALKNEVRCGLIKRILILMNLSIQKIIQQPQSR